MNAWKLKEGSNMEGRKENLKPGRPVKEPGRPVKENQEGTSTPVNGKSSKTCRSITKKDKHLKKLHLKGQNMITNYLELKNTMRGDVGTTLGLGKGMGSSRIVSDRNSTPAIVSNENLLEGKTTEAKFTTGSETTHQTSGI